MRKVIVVTHGKQEKGELNSLGYKQCAWVGTRIQELLPGVKLDSIVSSPVKRCIDSARQVAMSLGEKSPKVDTDDLLKDRQGQRQREDLTDVLNKASANHLCILLCGHGDLASCFKGQIDRDGLDANNEAYFKHGPAIAIFNDTGTSWEVEAIEILRKETQDGWISVRNTENS